MCLIIDANVIALIFRPTPPDDFQPVRDALYGQAAVAVRGGKLSREYEKIQWFQRLLVELDRRGSARTVPDSPVEEMTEAVTREGLCISDDPHIIALARVANTRLLCSHDQALHKDFTNPKVLRPQGKVFQKRAHRHLIREFCAKRKSNSG